MSETEVVKKVQEIVKENTGFSGDEKDIDLVETGYIQSLSMINIVMGIEAEYGIEVEAADLVRNNFRTVDSIADLVMKYIGKE